jgi:hypothetical protein
LLRLAGFKAWSGNPEPHIFRFFLSGIYLFWYCKPVLDKLNDRE